MLERVGVGPLGEKGNVGGLSGEKGGVKIGGSDGPKKKGIRQGKYAVVVMGACVVVRAARQGIGAIGSAGLMEEADVVVAKGEDVVGEATVDLLGASVILEVLMVGENVDNEFGSEEEVMPVFKGADDGKELAIPDRVISLGLSEGGGVVSYQVT